MKNSLEQPEPFILIADNNAIARKGVKFIIYSSFGKHKIMEAESAHDALELLEKYPITHLILEMELDYGKNMETFSSIRKRFPDIQILIYTKKTEKFSIQRMLHLGANSFLSKISQEDEVIRAIDLFLSNQPYLSPFLKENMIDENFGEIIDPISKLSERELSVLNYLLKGDGVKKIATKMNIKPNTVATFKLRIFNKFGVSNIIDLYTLAQLYNYRPKISDPLMSEKKEG